MTFQKPPRVLSASEILNVSFQFYLAGLGHPVGLIRLFIPFFVATFLNNAVGGFVDETISSFSSSQGMTGDMLAWILTYLAMVISVLAVFIVASAIINVVPNGIAVKYVSNQLERGHMDVGRRSIPFSPKIPSLLLASLITGALTALGLVLLVIPGIMAAIIFSLTVQVIMMEHLGVFESLKRSRKIVAGQWGKTFVVLLSVFIITFIMQASGETAGSFFDPQISYLVALTIGTLGQPIQPIALTYLYYSLRAKEIPVGQKPEPQPVAPVVVTPPAPPSPPSPYQAGYQPKFCYRCGQSLPSGAVFCPKCGENVKPWQNE